VVDIYGINLFYLFNSYTKNVIIYVLRLFWFSISVGMDQKIIGKFKPTLDLLNADV
jgi:hypothetical protein